MSQKRNGMKKKTVTKAMYRILKIRLNFNGDNSELNHRDFHKIYPHA